MGNKPIIELVVVLVLVVFGLWMLRNSNPVSNNVNTGSTPTEDVSAGSVNAGIPAGSISYAQALIKYKDLRIQLESTCQSNPDKLTVKNGTDIMIDNRAPVPRTVKVGSIFTIKAYGFKIVKVFSPTVPATWLVDCGQAQNVSTILIQK